MKKEKLIGMRVMNMNTHMTGIIEYIQDGCVAVNQHGNLVRYSYPAAFSGILELEDEFLQQEIKKKGTESSFEMVKRNFKFAINNEIEFLKSTGGKRYRIIDGERSTLSNGEYLYIFETDIDSWEEYKNIFEFDLYEMQENYRNASQITEYCNRVFDMSMIAINTPGKGVHELQTEKEFYEEMISQLLDDQRTGLAAILISNNEELKYLLSKFANYKQKFHDMTGEDFNIHRTRWNIINIDDTKGLEFSSVIVLSGRMSRNEKYIAFTRALDDLYVYAKIIGGVDDEEDKIEIQKSKMKDRKNGVELSQKHSKSEVKKAYAGSSVRQFFESKGVEVKDDREQGGRLWVIGEKSEIRNVVNEAIAKFGISGKYMSSDVTKNRRSWCTKTDK